MSKEQDFHELIRQQNTKAREDLWARIENRSDEEQVSLGDVLVKKSKVKQNVLIISAVVLAFLIAAIILIVELMPEKSGNEFRYCKFGDYYSVEVDESIEQYSKDKNLDILYFNWSNESEYLFDEHFIMNSTDEIICLKEILIDENGFYITQYVTVSDIGIDFLDVIKNACTKVININSITVNWTGSSENSAVYFSNNNFNYYLSIEGFIDENYLSELIQTLKI